MDIVLYGVSVLISFFGLLLGAFLGRLAPEEAHIVKHHLPFLQLFSLVLLFLVFYSFFPFFLVSALLLLAFAFIRIFWHKHEMNTLDYVVFGVLFPLASLQVLAHIYFTLVVFSFSVFAGLLFYVLHTVPLSGVVSHVKHHKHKNVHLSFMQITEKLFAHYLFFVIIAISTFVLASLLALFL